MARRRKKSGLGIIFELVGLIIISIVRLVTRILLFFYDNGLYRFNDTDDKDLKLILDAFNIEIPLKLYKKMELLNLKTSIEISNNQT
ncbi:MAG: hypothetical protein ACOX40_07475 [Bacilli bacterium]|jgi:hypothetical protein